MRLKQAAKLVVGGVVNRQIVRTPSRSTARRRFCGKYASRISGDEPLVEGGPSSEGQPDFDTGAWVGLSSVSSWRMTLLRCELLWSIDVLLGGRVIPELIV